MHPWFQCTAELDVCLQSEQMKDGVASERTALQFGQIFPIIALSGEIGICIVVEIDFIIDVRNSPRISQEYTPLYTSRSIRIYGVLFLINLYL